MYKILFLSVISTLAWTSTLYAEQTPVSIGPDPRIKRYFYDENNVYKLNLYLKSVTALQFGKGENVESILIGDSASWEVVKLKVGNVISVKPIIDQALTDMTVYTDQRVYTFEIRSVGEMKAGMEAGADQAFRTVFTYPEGFKTLDSDLFDGGPVNHDYMVSGHAPFRPLAVGDNTLQTTFILPKGSLRPAIFKVGLDREEKLVNSRTDGNRVVVDGTSDYWVMRIGNETVCVARASMVQATRKEVKNVR